MKTDKKSNSAGVPDAVRQQGERLGLELFEWRGELLIRTCMGRTLGRYNLATKRLHVGIDGLPLDDLAQALALLTQGRQRISA